jgi:hypothetical protein
MMSEMPRPKKADRARTGLLWPGTVLGSLFLIRKKRMPVVLRKRNSPVSGADRWIVSDNPPEDTCWRTAAVLSGTGAGAVVAETTGDTGDGTAVTGSAVGSGNGTAVAGTAVCAGAGAPAGEGILPVAGEPVRDV